MAQLTWRNVDAPHLSTRDLALAGGQITNSFDRLGMALNSWQTGKEDDAVDAELGKYLGISDPDQLQKAMATYQGPYAKKVLGELNSLLSTRLEQRSSRLAGDAQQENVLNTQADAVDVSGVLQAAHDGDPAAIAAARQLVIDGSKVGARALGRHSGDVYSAYDGGGDDRREGARDKVDANYKAGSLVNDGIRARAAAAESGAHVAESRARLSAIGEERERARAGRQGAEFGATFLDRINKINPQYGANAAQLVVNTPEYRAMTPEARQGVLAGIKSRSGEVFQDTPWNSTSNDALRTGSRLAVADGNAAVADTLINDNLTRNNPGLSILNTSKDPKYQSVKVDDVIARYAKTGIANPGGYVEEMRAKGVSLPELMAAPDVIDMSDRNFNIWKAPFYVFTGAGALQKDGFGSNVAGFDFTSGTHRANAGFDAVQALRKPGGLAKANQDAAASMAPLISARNTLSMLKAQATAERQVNGGRISPATQKAIEAASAQIDEIVASARGNVK